ncbi:16274_t:CDS:2 [Cetraspora pellucida]|uniref:16274_t:CDS:1 n=1 Tax=Cetraspora pellucida TaxID=1433469 RepID=A0A9N9A0W5_9GLOM|nr:16274_t:CDS:2 [Cetraspora pellucida]
MKSLKNGTEYLRRIQILEDKNQAQLKVTENKIQDLYDMEKSSQ